MGGTQNPAEMFTQFAAIPGSYRLPSVVSDPTTQAGPFVSIDLSWNQPAQSLISHLTLEQAALEQPAPTARFAVHGGHRSSLHCPCAKTRLPMVRFVPRSVTVLTV